ncbi:MAG: DUF6569 family protein [Phycisphaerae bacterium]|nr:DUF6569 family protein [Phycisphaerae bacterium]
MARTGSSGWAWAVTVAALILAGAMLQTTRAEEQAAGEADKVKILHVPEVLALLGDLAVDPPRTHKSMVVFPIRWSGKQAPGAWETLDDAVAGGHLVIREKGAGTVPEVQVENTGDTSAFLMSGEIVKGGKQTRVVRFDSILEPKQTVAVAVFCIEQSRWAGGKDFESSRNLAPASIRDRINRGAQQGEVWHAVRSTGEAAGAASETQSLDEMLESEKVQKQYKEAHEDLGEFSPPDTIGIAVGDLRTGRVVGIELFGRRDLFERLQEKLIEGYTTDLVVAGGEWDEKTAKPITEKDVQAFLQRAAAGKSRYEDTPGSGRGVDLESGTLRGKGVALGGCIIHLSIQDVQPAPTPARPIVGEAGRL